MKLFSLNFILSLNETPKAHCFCFLQLIQRSAVQQKSNKATLPNTKTFSTVKLTLCVQSLYLLLHNNFLVFNISDNCWKSSHNLWTLPNHNSRVTWGFRFPCMLQLVRSISHRHVFKTKRTWETTGKWLYEMMDKSRRGKLVIVSLPEHKFCFIQGRTQGGGLGLTPLPPWAWYFTKSSSPAQRRLIVFAYFLLVNLSTYCKYHGINWHANFKEHCKWAKK